MQVLGIPRNADSNQIARVYRKKIAEAKGSESETDRIEKAHTSIMMAGLISRLSVRNVSYDEVSEYMHSMLFSGE